MLFAADPPSCPSNPIGGGQNEAQPFPMWSGSAARWIEGLVKLCKPLPCICWVQNPC
jgi:hypothetical protein